MVKKTPIRIRVQMRTRRFAQNFPGKPSPALRAPGDISDKINSTVNKG
jgi:hypothetical protein